jgi:hypothetical protein
MLGENDPLLRISLTISSYPDEGMIKSHPFKRRRGILLYDVKG